MDTCICMAESLRYTPETITTLLIGYVYVCVCVCVSRSVMTDSVTPCTVAHQAPLSRGFPRQEYWSGLPFPPLGDLPNQGIQPASPALSGQFFTAELPGKLVTSLQTGKTCCMMGVSLLRRISSNTGVSKL